MMNPLVLLGAGAAALIGVALLSKKAHAAPYGGTPGGPGPGMQPGQPGGPFGFTPGGGPGSAGTLSTPLGNVGVPSSVPGGFGGGGSGPPADGSGFSGSTLHSNINAYVLLSSGFIDSWASLPDDAKVDFASMYAGPKKGYPVLTAINTLIDEFVLRQQGDVDKTAWVNAISLSAIDRVLRVLSNIIANPGNMSRYLDDFKDLQRGLQRRKDNGGGLIVSVSGYTALGFAMGHVAAEMITPKYVQYTPFGPVYY